ncbi:MAG TPA: trypsin-like peptidase domain-containing protein [Acidimicrobiales bacterium]|nr:trypsin-like peptidase domain-containing protein [Acidimicrobiales bacterium]
MVETPGEAAALTAAPNHPPGQAPPTYVVMPPARSSHVVLIAVVAIIVAMIVAAGAGAGVDYAMTHSGSSSSGSGASSVPSNVNVAAVTAKVDPALVDIDTTVAEGGVAAGTGMVLTTSGLVLTNNHVIENATTIKAQSVKTGRTYSATVLGYSVTDDVALLQLNGAAGLTTIPTGNSSSLNVGQTVVAIGNAGGQGGTPNAVAGFITALDQTITAGDPGALSETLHGMIETDAAIAPGDSGGSLATTSGRVVGMITAAAVNVSNQGYAIPINQALVLAAQIKSGQASATVHIGPRALLGVEAIDGVAVVGAQVEVVQPGSPADKAGIAVGDTVVSVNGSPIASAQDLSNALLDEAPGDTVTVGWVDAHGTGHRAVIRLTTGPPA